MKRILVCAIAAAVLSACSGDAPPPQQTANAVTVDTAPPSVIETYPRAGQSDVAPGAASIRVVFSKPMRAGWSFVDYPGTARVPEQGQQPRQFADERTFELDVTLRPGTTYGVWLNSAEFSNFQDKDGRPAAPYLLVFSTSD